MNIEMSRNTITESQYLQVAGLLALARKHKVRIDECEEALKEILEPDEDITCGSHSGDAIWEDYDVATLLKKTGTVVASL